MGFAQKVVCCHKSLSKQMRAVAISVVPNGIFRQGLVRCGNGDRQGLPRGGNACRMGQMRLRQRLFAPANGSAVVYGDSGREQRFCASVQRIAQPVEPRDIGIGQQLPFGFAVGDQHSLSDRSNDRRIEE